MRNELAQTVFVISTFLFKARKLRLAQDRTDIKGMTQPNDNWCIIGLNPPKLYGRVVGYVDMEIDNIGLAGLVVKGINEDSESPSVVSL